MSVALWILGVLLGLIALALLAPIQFQGGGAVGTSGARLEGQVRWALGVIAFQVEGRRGQLRLLGIPLWSGPLGAREGKARREKKRKRHKRRKAKPSRWTRIQRGRRWLRLGRRCLKALHLSGRVEGQIGLAYPDQTARLVQLLDVLPFGRASVDIRPQWVEEIVTLRGGLRGWLIPGQLLGLLIIEYIKTKTQTRRAPRRA